MKIAIIEDENLAAERLEELIKQVEPNSTVLVKLESVEASVEWLRNNTPDLLFLDIQLADGICFAIFDKVSVDVPIIFTTAYDSYAIKAFKLNSVDYLLKPIRREELETAVLKFKKLRNVMLPDLTQLLKAFNMEKPSYKQRFLVQYGERIKNIDSESIACFYAMEKSVFLTTFQNQTFGIEFSLDKLQGMMNPDQFFRINRKVIINYKAIAKMIAFSRSRIKIELNPPLHKGIEALVSVERSSKFKKWIDK